MPRTRSRPRRSRGATPPHPPGGAPDPLPDHHVVDPLQQHSIDGEGEGEGDDKPLHLPPAAAEPVVAAAAAAEEEEEEDEWDKTSSVRLVRKRIRGQKKNLRMSKAKGEALHAKQVVVEAKVMELKHLISPLKEALQEDIKSAILESECVASNAFFDELDSLLRKMTDRLNNILDVENSITAGKAVTVLQRNSLDHKDIIISQIAELEVVKSKRQVKTTEKYLIRKALREQEHYGLQERGGAPSYAAVSALSRDFELILDGFKAYLKEFIVPKPEEKKSFHASQVKSMIDRGASTFIVKYEHLVMRSKSLAMGICQSYRTLRPKLTAIAKKFMREVWVEMCRTKLEYAQNSADIMVKFELIIEGLPNSHEMLETYLSRTLFKYYWYEDLSYLCPNEDGFIVWDGIFIDIINHHREGLSWNGEFTISDIEVYDGRLFKITSPAMIEFNPMSEVSMETAVALRSDFKACTFLIKKFQDRDGNYPPFFPELEKFLETPAEEFVKAFKSDDLYDKFLHYPALKPPPVRAHFLCDIYEICRAHDLEDDEATYKDVLYSRRPEGNYSWSSDLLASNIVVIKKVLEYQYDREEAGINASIHSGREIRLPNQCTFDSYAKYMRYLEIGLHSFRAPNYGCYCSETRHIIVHGPEYCKEKRICTPLMGKVNILEVTGDAGARKQRLKTKEVVELMCSQINPRMMPGVIAELLNGSAMMGKMKPVWELYKRSGFRSANVETHVLKAPESTRR